MDCVIFILLVVITLFENMLFWDGYISGYGHKICLIILTE